MMLVPSGATTKAEFPRTRRNLMDIKVSGTPRRQRRSHFRSIRFSTGRGLPTRIAGEQSRGREGEKRWRHLTINRFRVQKRIPPYAVGARVTEIFC